jgi:hypothetical protein
MESTRAGTSFIIHRMDENLLNVLLDTTELGSRTYDLSYTNYRI